MGFPGKKISKKEKIKIFLRGIFQKKKSMMMSIILSEFRAKHHFFRDTWFQRPSILNQGILKKAVWEIAALSFLKEMAWKWAGNGPRNLMLRQRSEEGWRNRFNQQLFATRERSLVPTSTLSPKKEVSFRVCFCLLVFAAPKSDRPGDLARRRVP